MGKQEFVTRSEFGGIISKTSHVLADPLPAVVYISILPELMGVMTQMER